MLPKGGSIIVAALSIPLSEPTFGTNELLFCMKTVAKLIIRFRVRVIVGKCKLINTSVPAK